MNMAFIGGAAGDHILTLLDRTTLPLIVTLHTVLEKPTVDERRVLEGLLRRASKIVVMAERGREILARVYGASGKQVVMIPHGVPDRPFVDPETLKAQFGWQGREVVLTFGLLAPGKGIETIIEALPAVTATHPNAVVRRAGRDPPQSGRARGREISGRAEGAGRSLGVGDNIAFVDAFVEHNELIDYLQASDIYATPYLNPAQITSGTLSYAVGVGKAVVSTPYVHATEILADGHGVLVDFRDSAAFAREIETLLSSARDRKRLSRTRLCARPHDDLAAAGRGDARTRSQHRSPPNRAGSRIRRLRWRPQPGYFRGRADERCDGHAPAFDLFGARSSPWLLYRRQCPGADADERGCPNWTPNAATNG